MGAEAGVDERELLGLRIEQRQLAFILVDRERLGEGVARVLVAERRRAGGVIGPGHPDPALAVDHVVVIVEPRIPGLFHAPVGRSSHRLRDRRHVRGRAPPARSTSTGGVTYANVFAFGSSTGRWSVAYSGEPKSLPYALTVGLRLSDEIRSWRYFFSLPQSQVVTTRLRSTPSGRVGFVERQFALGDAVGPVAEVLQRRAGELAGDEFTIFGAPGPTGCVAPKRLRRILKGPKAAGMVRVANWPSWWQPTQRLVLDRGQPLGLRDLLRNVGLAAELVLVRDLQHRIPVDRRIILRRSRVVRRRRRLEIEVLPRLGRRPSANR